MAKKNRELTTRRMPGGAQQYARPDSRLQSSKRYSWALYGYDWHCRNGRR
jgi:hypothetical protein